MITLYVQHTFFPKQQKKTTLNGFVVHFFAVVLHDYNVASRNFLVTRFMEEMFYVFLFTFLFPATHFHLGGRQHFSFSYRRYKIFMLFLRRNWSPLFFYLSLALSLLSTSVQTLKLSRKNQSALLLLFLPYKSGWLCTAETRGYLKCKISIRLT